MNKFNYIWKCFILSALLFPLYLSKVVAQSSKVTPDHVMILVFDQMRPDYIERFDLKNFKRLRSISTNYPNAYVGHSASITIVSHLVISSGLPPKSLPWQDDVLWDKTGILGDPGKMYETTRLNQDQILQALTKLPQENFLAARIRKKLNRGVFAIGQKGYATLTMGTDTAASVITMDKQADGNCKPGGLRVPDYIVQNKRYTIDCNSHFGTDGSFYQLDGNRFYPGSDKQHQGGDVWVADAALDIMNRENWGGMFLTFGAIDKFGHLTGEDDGMPSLAFQPPAHLKEIAKIADAQLGRLLDHLEAKKLLDKTLIIVTADHGGQTDWHYYGNGTSAILGHLENSKDDAAPFWLERVNQSGKVRLAMVDTGIRLWLQDKNNESAETVLRYLREVSGVIHIFRLVQESGRYSYREVYANLNRLSPEFKAWANKHNLELANTMACETGPDLVAFLENNAGFHKLGDHGGAQKLVQKIPMIVHQPKQRGRSDPKALRLVDVHGIVTKSLQL